MSLVREYNPEIHHRASMRKVNFNYASENYYFITICSKDRLHLFGEIVDDKMILSDIGLIAKNEWLNTPNIRDNIHIDEFIVMPNHVHLLFQITKSRGMSHTSIHPLQHTSINTSAFIQSPSKTVGSIIRGYKSATSSQVNILLQNQEPTSIWQNNYHDRIIRNDNELQEVRQYIKNNPVNWKSDSEYTLH